MVPYGFRGTVFAFLKASRKIPMTETRGFTTRTPLSTYRLQLNYRFTFSRARDAIGYLAELGITELYTSSYLRARPGSLHGYDIVNFGELNPEIGNEEDYEAFIAEQQKHGMGQVFDMVPNHMCVASYENAWWTDVLENGPSSIYARFFDINWQPVKQELKDKILVPILGDQYGRILESQELRLILVDGCFWISYWDSRLPIMPDTYGQILTYRLKDLEASVPADNPDYVEYLSINTELDHLPPYTEHDADKMTERNREKEIAKKRLAGLYSRSPTIRTFVDENVRIFNGYQGDARSFDLLDRLLREQAYRLSHWRVATEEINYRRFFDINDLAAIRMEDPVVFFETHKLVFRLIREGKVSGLRIDHPDGLYDPSEYFHRLQRNCFIETGLAAVQVSEEGVEGGGLDEDWERQNLSRQFDQLLFADQNAKPFYIVGEKILVRDESIPEQWPIYGTTGYEFLNLVNGLFVDSKNDKALERIYSRFIRRNSAYSRVVYEKKKYVMQRAMSSEINNLSHYLNRLSEKNRHTRDFTLNSLIAAIIEVIAFFPVYRTYVNNWNIRERDRLHIEAALTKAKNANPTINESIFDFLRGILLLECPPELNDDERKEWLDFVMRFQQITGPVMAKGLEDTSFYVYNRLISLNEVGGNPDRFGTSPQELHESNLRRQKSQPHAMITTSTHDSKRGEDVRTRINVLSEIPDEWRRRLTKWCGVNRKRLVPVGGAFVPDRNEEYFLYQTLLGAWPIGGFNSDEYPDFIERIKACMIKSIREAKINTSWVNPRPAYEDAVSRFVDAILAPSARDNAFLIDFEAFGKKISFCGMVNSLSQTLLKITSPGVPDFYQGTEVWNLSLVDPDNRRPVDYAMRRRMLHELKASEKEAARKEIAANLLGNWKDGRIKMYVTYKALNFRKGYDQQLERSCYTAVETNGPRAGNVFAFSRYTDGFDMIVAVPRLIAGFVEDGELKASGWDGSFLRVPEPSASAYVNVFTDRVVKVSESEEMRVLPLSEVFDVFPVALFKALDHGEEKHHER
jgi:(1->4)-alpha-D-glucan 1-alpha-D-glucosylmutase